MAKRIKHPKPKRRDPRSWNEIQYHAGGSITVWDIYQQRWVKTSKPSDRLLATLAPVERECIGVWIGGRE